jgi:DNA-binding IclR family transcriptional regulator
MRDVSIARPSPPTPDAGSGVGVLDRVVAILDVVEAGNARSLADVARATGYSRSTTHRLLQAMEAHDLLGYSGSRGYHLGVRLLRLANRASRELPLRDLAHPALARLCEMTGESAQLYVRSVDERVCIDAVESPSELRTIVPIGAALPLTKGSAGKLFLAWATPADHDRLTADLAPAELARLDQQIVTARRRGWAESQGEREPGVASVSAPIVGAHDALVAAVSVSGPMSRLDRGRAKALARGVMTAASEIERALGLRLPGKDASAQ